MAQAEYGKPAELPNSHHRTQYDADTTPLGVALLPTWADRGDRGVYRSGSPPDAHS